MQRCHKEEMEGQEEAMVYDPDYLGLDLQPEPSGLFDAAMFAKYLACETMKSLGGKLSVGSARLVKQEPGLAGTSDDSGVCSDPTNSPENVSSVSEHLQLPPVVQLARYCGIPFCLARKNSGIQLNCQKKGKKPNRWFMDVSLMSEEDAERHKEYLRKKENGLLPQKRRRKKAGKKLSKVRSRGSRSNAWQPGPSTSGLNGGKVKARQPRKQRRAAWDNTEEDTDEEEAYRLAQELMIELERQSTSEGGKAKPRRVSARPKKPTSIFQNLPSSASTLPHKAVSVKSSAGRAGAATGQVKDHSEATMTASPEASTSYHAGSKAAVQRRNKPVVKKKPTQSRKKASKKLTAGKSTGLQKFPRKKQPSGVNSLLYVDIKEEPQEVRNVQASVLSPFPVSHYNITVAATNTQCWLSAVLSGAADCCRGCQGHAARVDGGTKATSTVLVGGTQFDDLKEEFFAKGLQLKERRRREDLKESRDVQSGASTTTPQGEKVVLDDLNEPVPPKEKDSSLETEGVVRTVNMQGIHEDLSLSVDDAIDLDIWQATNECLLGVVEAVSTEGLQDHSLPVVPSMPAGEKFEMSEEGTVKENALLPSHGVTANSEENSLLLSQPAETRVDEDVELEEHYPTMEELSQKDSMGLSHPFESGTTESLQEARRFHFSEDLEAGKDRITPEEAGPSQPWDISKEGSSAMQSVSEKNTSRYRLQKSSFDPFLSMEENSEGISMSETLCEAEKNVCEEQSLESSFALPQIGENITEVNYSTEVHSDTAHTSSAPLQESENLSQSNETSPDESISAELQLEINMTHSGTTQQEASPVHLSQIEDSCQGQLNSVELLSKETVTPTNSRHMPDGGVNVCHIVDQKEGDGLSADSLLREKILSTGVKSDGLSETPDSIQEKRFPTESLPADNNTASTCSVGFQDAVQNIAEGALLTESQSAETATAATLRTDSAGIQQFVESSREEVVQQEGWCAPRPSQNNSEEHFEAAFASAQSGLGNNTEQAQAMSERATVSDSRSEGVQTLSGSMLEKSGHKERAHDLSKCLHVLVSDVRASPLAFDSLHRLGVSKASLDVSPTAAKSSTWESPGKKSGQKNKQAVPKPKVSPKKASKAKSPPKKQSTVSRLKAKVAEAASSSATSAADSESTDTTGISGLLLATATVTKLGKSLTKTSPNIKRLTGKGKALAPKGSAQKRRKKKSGKVGRRRKQAGNKIVTDVGHAEDLDHAKDYAHLEGHSHIERHNLVEDMCESVIGAGSSPIAIKLEFDEPVTDDSFSAVGLAHYESTVVTTDNCPTNSQENTGADNPIASSSETVATQDLTASKHTSTDSNTLPPEDLGRDERPIDENVCTMKPSGVKTGKRSRKSTLKKTVAASSPQQSKNSLRPNQTSCVDVDPNIVQEAQACPEATEKREGLTAEPSTISEDKLDTPTCRVAPAPAISPRKSERARKVRQLVTHPHSTEVIENIKTLLHNKPGARLPAGVKKLGILTSYHQATARKETAQSSVGKRQLCTAEAPSSSTEVSEASQAQQCRAAPGASVSEEKATSPTEDEAQDRVCAEPVSSDSTADAASEMFGDHLNVPEQLMDPSVEDGGKEQPQKAATTPVEPCTSPPEMPAVLGDGDTSSKTEGDGNGEATSSLIDCGLGLIQRGISKEPVSSVIDCGAGLAEGGVNQQPVSSVINCGLGLAETEINEELNSSADDCRHGLTEGGENEEPVPSVIDSHFGVAEGGENEEPVPSVIDSHLGVAEGGENEEPVLSVVDSQLGLAEGGVNGEPVSSVSDSELGLAVGGINEKPVTCVIDSQLGLTEGGVSKEPVSSDLDSRVGAAEGGAHEEPVPSITDCELGLTEGGVNEEPIAHVTNSQLGLTEGDVNEEPVTHVTDSQLGLTEGDVNEEPVTHVTDSQLGLAEGDVTEEPVNYVTNMQLELAEGDVNEEPFSPALGSGPGLAESSINEDASSSAVDHRRDTSPEKSSGSLVTVAQRKVFSVEIQAAIRKAHTEQTESSSASDSCAASLLPSERDASSSGRTLRNKSSVSGSSRDQQKQVPSEGKSTDITIAAPNAGIALESCPRKKVSRGSRKQKRKSKTLKRLTAKRKLSARRKVDNTEKITPSKIAGKGENKAHRQLWAKMKQSQAGSTKMKAKSAVKQKVQAAVAAITTKAVVKKPKNSAFKIVRLSGATSSSLSRKGIGLTRKRKRFMYVETDTGETPDPPCKKRGRPPGPKIILDRSQANLCFEPAQLLTGPGQFGADFVGDASCFGGEVPSWLLMQAGILAPSMTQGDPCLVPSQSDPQLICTVLPPQSSLPGDASAMPESGEEHLLQVSVALPASQQNDPEMPDIKPVLSQLSESTLPDVKPLIDELKQMNVSSAPQLLNEMQVSEAAGLRLNEPLLSLPTESSTSLENVGQLNEADAAELEASISQLPESECSTPGNPQLSQPKVTLQRLQLRHIMGKRHRVGRKKIKDRLFTPQVKYKEVVGVSYGADRRRSRRPKKSRLTDEQIRMAQDSPTSDLEGEGRDMASECNRPLAKSDDDAGSDIEFVSTDYSNVDFSAQRLFLENLRVETFPFGELGDGEGVMETLSQDEISDTVGEQGGHNLAGEAANSGEFVAGEVGFGEMIGCSQFGDIPEEAPILGMESGPHADMELAASSENLELVEDAGFGIEAQTLGVPYVKAEDSLVGQGYPNLDGIEEINEPLTDIEAMRGDVVKHVLWAHAEDCELKTTETEEHAAGTRCNCMVSESDCESKQRLSDHVLAIQGAHSIKEEVKLKAEPGSLMTTEFTSPALPHPQPQAFTLGFSCSDSHEASVEENIQPECSQDRKQEANASEVSIRPCILETPTNRVHVPIGPGAVLEGSPSLTIFVKTGEGRGVWIEDDPQNFIKDEFAQNS